MALALSSFPRTLQAFTAYTEQLSKELRRPTPAEAQAISDHFASTPAEREHICEQLVALSAEIASAIADKARTQAEQGQPGTMPLGSARVTGVGVNPFMFDAAVLPKAGARVSTLGQLTIERRGGDTSHDPIRGFSLRGNRVTELVLDELTQGSGPRVKDAEPVAAADAVESTLVDAHQKQQQRLDMIRAFIAKGDKRPLGVIFTELSALPGGDPLKPNAPICPKDPSLEVSRIHTALGSGDRFGNFVMGMAKAGQVEGFEVVAHATAGELDDYKEKLPELRAQPNLALVKGANEESVWAQDYAENHLDGSISAPSLELNQESARDAMWQGRAQEFHPTADVREALRGVRDPEEREKIINRQFPNAVYTTGTMVAERENQKAAATTATALGKSFCENLGHMEGGNVVVGTDADGSPYAIIGRDSLLGTKRALDEALGQDVPLKWVQLAVALDTGIGPDKLNFVTQATGFHLDMDLLLVGEKRVLLNDSRKALAFMEDNQDALFESHKPLDLPAGADEAQRLQHEKAMKSWQRDVEWIREEFPFLRDEAERAAQKEDRLAQELEALGFDLVRVGGRFSDGIVEFGNFFNGQIGQNHQGEVFYLTQGSWPLLEDHFFSQLTEAKVPIDRIYLSSASDAEFSLRSKGGYGCRGNTEGRIADSIPTKQRS